MLTQVWAKRLPRGALAIFFLNSDNRTAHNVSIPVAIAQGTAGDAIAPGTSFTVRDLYTHMELPIQLRDGVVAVQALPPHHSRLLLLTPVGPQDVTAAGAPAVKTDGAVRPTGAAPETPGPKTAFAERR